jgi:hypothetical protein
MHTVVVCDLEVVKGVTVLVTVSVSVLTRKTVSGGCTETVVIVCGWRG